MESDLVRANPRASENSRIHVQEGSYLPAVTYTASYAAPLLIFIPRTAVYTGKILPPSFFFKKIHADIIHTRIWASSAVSYNNLRRSRALSGKLRGEGFDFRRPLALSIYTCSPRAREKL